MLTVVFFLIFFKVVQPGSNPTFKINLNTCKLTHTGTEYIGKLSRTETNVTCQFWNSVTQKGWEKLVDEAFPDGSKVLAKNYCRNPTKDPKGPWCYTTSKKLIYDYCDVPLCKSPDCRVSGTGMEYTGLLQKSTSGNTCTKWKGTHKLKGKGKESAFKDKFFPEASASQAGKRCRNPSGNVTGPWCYVEGDVGDLEIRELCDVPFCDDLGTIKYSEGSFSGEYFFFSSINTTQSFKIRFRLWDPADWLRGQVFLFLSAYDVDLNRHDIERWSSGVEIMFSHLGSGILSSDEDTLGKTPLILSAAKWTELEITWLNPDNSTLLIQVFEGSKPKPIAIGELLTQGTIFEVESFRYFSIAGSSVLWDVVSSEQEEDEIEECFVHTISRMNFTRFWLIKKTTLGKDVEIFVRAKREAVLILRTAPMTPENQVQITIGDKDKVRITTFDSKNAPRQLNEASWPNILDFWLWEYFKITLLKDKLQLFWVRKASTELVIEATHYNIENVLWITFASSWISYWTIYCDPRGVADPPPPAPPECVSTESEAFNGTLSVTRKGRQCIPWTDKSIPEKYQNKDLFESYGGVPACQNFCRNLDKDPKGAYCMVRDKNSDSGFGLEHCHPRACSLGDCKVAGIANDYTGQLNVTRSKRECKTWSKVMDVVVKVTNFPDPTLDDAGNFCRNPSKNVSGSWCFTTDPKVPKDLCFIKDCDKPLECTVLTTGFLHGSYIYVLPHWRKYGLKLWLKAWNPDIYEGLAVSLLSIDRSKEYILLIGDQDNEKVKFYYKDLSSGARSFKFFGVDPKEPIRVETAWSLEGRNEKKKKTPICLCEIELVHKTLPHLVPTGKWGGYWLRPGPGKVELGYHGVPNSFFEWSSSGPELSFDPAFINFGTIKNHWIGVNFECTECLTEQTSAKKGNKVYPINLWRDEMITSNLLLNLRGTGSAIVTVTWTADFNRILGIQILSQVKNINIIKFKENDEFEVIATYPVSSPLLEHDWSEYIISFTEASLIVHKDGAHVFEWTSPTPLLLYWFSVSADGGTIIWSANCPSADIDGEPRDGNWGKWGPWSCSVTCGRGEGRIERKCDDPAPNVFGKECKGSPVYEGPCNDFPCGQISPGTKDSIRQYLSSQHKSLQVNAKERIVLPCNPQGVSLISAEVSEMNITWTHNGFPYNKIRFHTDKNYGLVISHAQESHNGIYLCMAYQPDSIPSKVVLEVISLIVIKTKPTKKIRHGGSMNLKCNGMALSYVYADLSQRWQLNGTIWKNYGLGTLQMFTTDKLENITHSHAGIWTCVIIQEDFGFNWTTNWIYLKVKSAPSFWSHLMEDVATAPLFGKLGTERNAMILFFVLLAVFIISILGIMFFLVKWLKRKPTRK